MAKISRGSPAPLILLILFFSITPSIVAPKKAPKKPPPPVAKKEYIPFIKCQVCEKIAHQIHHQVKKKEAGISPKKVSEFQIIEVAENVCNLKKAEADWILQIDIVEKGDRLELEEQGIEGQCNSECKSIERVCQEVMGYFDTDIAEFVYSTKPSIDLLVNYLCNDLSKACSVKSPPVPKNWIPGEPFIAKPSKDAEMEKMLRSMEGMPGAPNMKMYSREDLMNMNNVGGDEADDDDEDEDDDKFPANLGKVLREKGTTANKDFKQKFLQGVKETQKAIEGHISNLSKWIRRWWTGKNTGRKSPKKASKSEL